MQRFKCHGFLTQTEAELAKRKLLTEVKKLTTPNEENVAQPRERQVVADEATVAEDASLWGSLDEEIQTSQDEAPEPVTIDSVTKECEEYFKEPNIPRKNKKKEWSDPLEWWNSPSGEKYPNLRKIALKFLIVSGTSVPSERLFRYQVLFTYVR